MLLLSHGSPNGCLGNMKLGTVLREGNSKYLPARFTAKSIRKLDNIIFKEMYLIVTKLNYIDVY